MVLTRIHNWILCSAGRIHSTSPHPVCLNGLLTFQLIFHIHFSSSHLHSHVLPVFSFDHLSRGLVNNANHKAPYCVIFFAMLLPYKTPGTIMCQYERMSEVKGILVYLRRDVGSAEKYDIDGMNLEECCLLRCDSVEPGTGSRKHSFLLAYCWLLTQLSLRSFLEMEAVRLSEMSLNLYWITRPHIPENGTTLRHRAENVRSKI